MKIKLGFILLAVCTVTAKAQVNVPESAQAATRNSTAKQKKQAALNLPRANVEVCWQGETNVVVRIDDKRSKINTGACVNMQLKIGSVLKVAIEKTAATYYAEEPLLVDSSGGRLYLSLQEKGNYADIVVMNYESTRARQKREEANRALIQGISANMIYVEGGSFTMGCTLENDRECEDESKPEHQVTLNSFKMGKYEVTQAEWKAVMGNNPSRFNDCPNCPVEGVSWNDIQVFIRKLNDITGGNYRLPTEAEWEYAARGGKHQNRFTFSGSDSLTAVAWCSGTEVYFNFFNFLENDSMKPINLLEDTIEMNTVPLVQGKRDYFSRGRDTFMYINKYSDSSAITTNPVGKKLPNTIGLYDMSGNVWEWCNDWYDENYFSNSPSINPHGPLSGTNRVMRGGSRSSYRIACRVTKRFHGDPGNHILDVGFRLVSPGS